ncbi:uncharacterized protein Z520_06854 [Fonsecaea multimorphosa CBS 102226]|uniref:Rhodopsin domain-containing protein n=1 Tax=Fonsecaea multimorphosa CBS 102226 TaxID=1442371 RepID=A0A0D2JVB7_9EURO|nr:uncharacterized protein Z520_06854 [Fonsecaea multimorphosa CBS 102226]KIX97402.1 hypothetical protein Z520_06854 [Fonsecaea multimorphosa CBS 102226]
MSTNPNPGFVPESWSLYGVGAFFVVLRLAGKIKRVGVKHLEIDDALIAFGFVAYTILVVAFNEMLKGPGSNLMTPEEEAALTPELKAGRIRGSKWVFVSEHAELLTIWSMKAAMLVLYAKLIDKTRQRRLLWAVVAWVCCAFVGDELALFTICRPLSQYWAVPPQNWFLALTQPKKKAQCSTYQYYQIVNAVFNISTDILIMLMGIPPVLSARLSLQQKLILGIIFGMGGFVIVAAILRAIYCLVPSLISYVYMNWYFREASVSIYVTTLPGIWVFLKEMFPIIQRLTSRPATKPSNSQTIEHRRQQPSYWREPSKHNNRSQFDAKEDLDFDLDTYPISKSMITTAESDLGGHGVGRSDSGQGDADSTSSTRYDAGLNEIRCDKTFTVESIPRGRP